MCHRFQRCTVKVDQRPVAPFRAPTLDRRQEENDDGDEEIQIPRRCLGGPGLRLIALTALGAACTGGNDSDATAADLGGAEATAVDAHEDDPEAADQAHENAGDDHAVADAGHDEADVDHGLAHEAADDPGVERTITVIAQEFAFGQQEIHVRVGETVRLVFQNAGAVFHDITAPDFAGEADVQGAEHHETTMEGMGDVAVPCRG
jgi:plastocyanin